MKRLSLFAVMFLAVQAAPQNMDRVYNRDTGELFRLKEVKTTSTVLGPIVKNTTVFTYDNPYTKLTEASFWFGMNPGAVLGGFAYWYKDEYVKGVLMDKDQAWFIYSAITSRNRDPGIMDQVSPESYHAQIFPIATGYELRIELVSIEFLMASSDRFVLPKPRLASSVPFDWRVRVTDPSLVLMSTPGREGDDSLSYSVYKEQDIPLDVTAFSQRFTDGRVYVCGIVRGAPAGPRPQISGLRDVFFVNANQPKGYEGFYFIGWMRNEGKLDVRQGQALRTAVLDPVKPGSAVAQLWAQQKLARGKWRTKDDVLRFSLRYNVPSRYTALLAVPQEEMRLFEEKKREYLENMRRQKLEEERARREWSKQKRDVNWSSSRGGDPEIRVPFQEATRVFAMLPDGRILTLKPAGKDLWGGNFDIPVDAPEGDYVVRVYAIKRDGTREEKTVRYQVDRTSPEGVAKVWRLGGALILTVRSEPGLAFVYAYLPNGTRIQLRETEPGIYSVAIPLPSDGFRASDLLFLLIDSAHNRRELRCTS